MKLASPYLAPSLPALGVAVAFVLWLLLTPEQVLRVTSESGPIEVPNAVLYLVLAAVLALQSSIAARTRFALAAVFAAFGAREFDMHNRWTEKSVLKVSFYLGDAPAHHKLVALALLAIVACAAVYLLRRHARSALRMLRERHPLAITLAWFVGTIVATKLLDRSVNLLEEDFGVAVGASVHALVSAVEEVVELSLPLLGGLAVLQHRAAATTAGGAG